MRRLHWWKALALAMILVLHGAIGTIAHAAGGQVWVNTSSGVYHCPGTRYYGNTKRGEFLDEAVATSRGYRAAYGNPCPDAARATSQGATPRNLAPSERDATDRVWINTGSSVYHCPGTRYYGNTKRGRFASEAEAVAGGNRPAHGTRCH
jgi:hypothetical protein